MDDRKEKGKNLITERKSLRANCKMEMKMSSGSLPGEVVFDILTRLPVKSLCRFKCVSKSWLSTISTVKFSNCHFHHSRLNSKLLLSFFTYDGTKTRRYLFIADQTEQENKSPLVLRHQATLPVKEHQIAESVTITKLEIGDSLTVAGLTLNICSDLFVVTNPITKASVSFSRAFPEQDHSCRRYVCFGFDPVDSKHKVLESFYSSSVKRMVHRVCVVSVSDSGNWRSIEGPDDVYFRKQEVCIDGVVYSKANMTNGIYIVACIAAFDVRSEKFQVARLSINGNLGELSNLNLPFPCRFVEFEGKLAIVRYPFYDKDNNEDEAGLELWFKEEAVLDLWVMEDFEKQVWSLKFTCLQSFTSARRLIGSTIDGELIFKDCTQDADVPFTLYFLNMKTGNFWRRDVHLPPEYHFMTASTVGRLSATPLVERLCI